VRTSYDAVELRGVGGAVTVINQSGAVSVSGLTGAALSAYHTIETSYADIAVDFPAAAAAPSFELETTYGRITSDFDGAREERGSRQMMLGEGEEGGATLSLTARNGNISLRRR
jgi:DUF4097 and DUF4098 domain-containing protein YvlB